MSIHVINPLGELVEDSEEQYESILRFEKIKRNYVKNPINSSAAIEYARLTGRDLEAKGESKEKIKEVVIKILFKSAGFDLNDPEFEKHIKIFDESRRAVYEYYRAL